MRAPHRKYTGALKVPHGTSGTNSPCAMRSWKCRITGYRDRQRVAIGRLETRRFGCLRIDAKKGSEFSLCSCPSFSIPVRLGLNSKKSPRFLRGRGFKLDRVRPLQSPVSPGTLHLVRAVSFYRSKSLDCLSGAVEVIESPHKGTLHTRHIGFAERFDAGQLLRGRQGSSST